MGFYLAPPVRLDQRLWFPDPRRAARAGSRNGLVALGGDFSVARLLLAYRSGIFPWSVDPITWWSPDPRAIFDLDRFHISRRLEKLLRRDVFQTSRDRAFREVIAACAETTPGRESTWITSEFIRAYTELHERGHAHSVECWQDGRLAGGIYGVAVGGCFAGESMFHRVSNASNAALFHLVQHLRDRGFRLFDIQVMNAHTRRLGALDISRSEYLERLGQAVELPCAF